MKLNVYLAGEIHSSWRAEIITACQAQNLDIAFTAPVTDHAASDDCGVAIMGDEANKFWHDNKGANLNSMRTRKAIKDADIVVVRFGEKYKQWNAAFDAGYAHALGKSVIVLQMEEHNHALKEVNAAAQAVCYSSQEVAQCLSYILSGTLP
ncbi:MAG: YtoQ family protein [Amylibacter sp.]